MPEPENDLKVLRKEDDYMLAYFSNVFKDVDDPAQMVKERTWFRNILYYLGEQWLLWIDSGPGTGAFAARYRLNYAMPTPVANIIRDYIKSIKALHLNKQYTSKVWPNSEEIADREAALLGNAVLVHLNTRNEAEIEEVKEDTVMWLGLAGNAFVRTFAELNGNGFVLDASGNPIKKADVCSDIILPFNVRVAPLGTNIRKKKYIGIKTLVYREWAEDTYGTKLDASAANMRQIEYQSYLLSLVSEVSPWKGRGLLNLSGNGDMDPSEMIILEELEFKPDHNFPKGQYVVRCGDKIIKNEEKLPIPVDKDGRWDYTVDHFTYNRTPGGFWSTGGVDDLISPQNTINEIDQALAVNRKSLGRPILFTPSDLVLKRISDRGQGMLAVKYDSQAALGQKVQIHPGVPYPQQIQEERNNQREVAQEAGGDPKNVLRGKAPYAGAPGIALDILRETAEQGHAPDIRRFYRVWGGVERKRLVIFSWAAKDSRLIKIKGKGNQIQVKLFRGANLRDNTDVRLELDSGLSSTNAGKNELMMQLIQYKFWHPVEGPKPDVRREFLRRIGMAGFPEEDNLHRDRAELENAEVVAAKSTEDLEHIQLPPIPTGETDPETGEEIVIDQDDPVFEVDDHYSHAVVHDQLILSKEFRELKPAIQMILILHRQFHAQKLTEGVMAEQTLNMAQGQAQGAREGALAAEKEQATGGQAGMPPGGGGM